MDSLSDNTPLGTASADSPRGRLVTFELSRHVEPGRNFPIVVKAKFKLGVAEGKTNHLIIPASPSCPPVHYLVTTMTAEQLTYAGIAERLGVSTEAARAVARRHGLSRSRGNDGKTRVSIDIEEIEHRPLPARRPVRDQAVAKSPPISGEFLLGRPFRDIVDTLKGRITTLEAELGTSKAALSVEQQRSAGHRTDFERERDRADRLNTIVDRMIAELQAVRTSLEAAHAPATEPAQPTAAAGDRPRSHHRRHLWCWPLALVTLMVALFIP